jgi:hypothetical protein
MGKKYLILPLQIVFIYSIVIYMPDGSNTLEQAVTQPREQSLPRRILNGILNRGSQQNAEAELARRAAALKPIEEQQVANVREEIKSIPGAPEKTSPWVQAAQSGEAGPKSPTENNPQTWKPGQEFVK